MRRALSGTVALLLCACGCVTEQPPPIPPPPPRAFLTFPATTVVATSVKGSLTTTGCRKVAQVQLLESGNFIADARYSGEPTAFELPPALFNPIYPARGFSTQLSLTAKVVCEETNTQPDGGFTVKEGLSQPVAITFLPVASVRSDSGRQTLPDTFVAEGGIGSQPTTFVGCVGTSTGGSALVRIDQNGLVRAVNESLPFPCSYLAQFSPLNATTQTRWLWVPQLGAFAFDGNLNVTSVFQEKIAFLVASADGDAVVAVEEAQVATKSQLLRLRVRPSTGQPVPIWTSLDSPFATGFPGEFNAEPVVDIGTRRVFAASWQKRTSETTGRVAVLIYDYDNGRLVNGDVNGNVPVVISQEYPQTLNRAIKPVAAFKEDGQLLYVPLLQVDLQGNMTTTVFACATNTPGCQGPARRWTSVIFQGELTTVVPFSRGNFLAIVGPFATYLLSTGDGVVRNLANPGTTNVQPLRPSGSLVTVGVVPGKSSDLYLINAPPKPDQNTLTFPTEVIATDAPQQGEVWKLEIQGGTQPVDSIYLAVDDNGQAWMRLGPDQIRPLGIAEYRQQRGATTPP